MHITKKDFALVWRYALTKKQKYELLNLSSYKSIRTLTGIKPKDDNDNSLISTRIADTISKCFSSHQWELLFKLAKDLNDKKGELRNSSDVVNVKHKYEKYLNQRRQDIKLELNIKDINTKKVLEEIVLTLDNASVKIKKLLDQI